MELPPFIEIPDCTVTLGWRFDKDFPPEAKAVMESHYDGYDYRANIFSPNRTVSLKKFFVTSEPVDWIDLVEDEEVIEEAESLEEVCNLLNVQLNEQGLRLLTEDEFEAAAGGGLFLWGNEIPEGSPYDDHQRMVGDDFETPQGVRFNSDTYATELVDGYLKMGDGGVSVCGGEPWPMPWLCLSPTFRVPKELYAECLSEYLETTVLHLAKIEF